MTLLAQVTLITKTGDSADYQTNGFYASESGYTTGELDSWANALKTFYDDIYTDGGLRGFAQNNHLVKFYNVGGTPPNYPVYETTFNLTTNPVAIELPMEMCLAVSYRNNSNNTVLRARRRGRIYISGWASARNAAGRPDAAAYQGLCTAYTDYCDTLNTIGSLTAVIYSRVQDITNNVEEVWCDNEWDTQRRRGGVATARETQTVA